MPVVSHWVKQCFKSEMLMDMLTSGRVPCSRSEEISVTCAARLRIDVESACTAEVREGRLWGCAGG